MITNVYEFIFPVLFIIILAFILGRIDPSRDSSVTFIIAIGFMSIGMNIGLSIELMEYLVNNNIIPLDKWYTLPMTLAIGIFSMFITISIQCITFFLSLCIKKR